jgi:hypothetical protein
MRQRLKAAVIDPWLASAKVSISASSKLNVVNGQGTFHRDHRKQ